MKQAILDWLMILNKAWLIVPVFALLIAVLVLLANWASRPRT
jgi:hypothetical protein